MVRAGLYARVSRKEQKRGWSIGSQLDACRDYANREGWQVVAEYTDVHSAYREGEDEVSLRRPASTDGSFALVGEWGLVRPDLYRLLTDAEDGQIDVVIVWKADRLSRKSGAQDLARDFLRKVDVRFISVTEDIDTGRERNFAHERNISTQGQAESEKISERVKEGKKARARAGYSNASWPPYGYKRKKIGKKTWAEPKPSRKKKAAIIAAYEAYATGQYTDQEIADLLNREGFPTYGRKFGDRAPINHWTQGAARKMLQNPFYAGWVRYGKKLHKGKHKPIISQELFDQAQAVREHRGRFVRGGRRASGVYLLQKVARCVHCGGIMHMEYKKTRGQYRYQYYRCPAAVNGLPCAVAGKTVPMDVIDDQVGELVKRLQLPDDWRERLAELAGHQEDREQVESKRRYIEGKLRRLREVYVDGDLSRGEYDRRRAMLKAELDTLQVPDTPEIEQAGETLESLGQEWASAPKRYQRDMLRVIFEAVFVDVQGRRLVCVKPWPQFAPLFRLDGLEERDGCFYDSEGKGQEAGSEG